MQHIFCEKTADGLVKRPIITEKRATLRQGYISQEWVHENSSFAADARGVASRDKNTHRRKNTHLALKKICLSPYIKLMRKILTF
jgi:hypothetical protein